METSETDQKLHPSELPFLVTHWLSNYQNLSTDDCDKNALDRIHQAASEIAFAFRDLGAFGTTDVPSILTPKFCGNKVKNTFQDLKRKWSSLAPNQLESVAESAAFAATASSTNVPRRTNFVQYSQELRLISEDGGHRLGKIVDLTRDIGNNKNTEKDESTVRSILHNLPLLQYPSQNTGKDEVERIFPYIGPKQENNNCDRVLPVSILSDFRMLALKSGTAMRDFLSTREKATCEAIEIEKLEQSLSRQINIKKKTEQKQSDFVDADNAPCADSDQILQEIQNCDRVITQLKNKLEKLVGTHMKSKQNILQTKEKAWSIYMESRRIVSNFRDPYQTDKPLYVSGTFIDCNISCNKIMNYIEGRKSGLSQNNLISYQRQIGRPFSQQGASEVRQAILSNRFSHALTISTHLSFPVYCLKFDKSGRYFVTGADDCLVKIFFLGASLSQASSGRPLRFTYGANARGAILISTLRGHAGVICDIDVSCDNAFLATASDDGDVRVWGMKDGCPIAILRGHVGGANMVSWSLLTPYRLVSSGMDGLARIWDVREAALKRYSTHIGMRPEYTLPLTTSEKRFLEGKTKSEMCKSAGGNDGQVTPPPLPQREDEAHANNSIPEPPPADPAVNIALPEAPANLNNIEENGEAQNREINPGAFVSNDVIDEGVRIIVKLQHGEKVQNSNGPSTRSRDRTVKVISVARCPRGGHFATGSDDGYCRVWQDEDDNCVALIDGRNKRPFSKRINQVRKLLKNQNGVPSDSTLLAILKGHMSSITDLHYSHEGDRILTASQKDGNARIWSFGGQHHGRLAQNMHDFFLNPKQIVLKLSNINENKKLPSTGRSGKKRSNTSGSSINCDVAVWTRDDSKIVTSQSSPLRTKNQDIVPGSQVLLVWDSWSGHCLIAIKQAHQQQCPVIVTHPMEYNIICSAGADGVAKVWDLEKGKCIYQHHNKILDGPVSASNEKGSSSGYLDGSFDEHGNNLVLVDDNGRITLFDCLRELSSTEDLSAPTWMKEQYFANDYYELFYNSNGYCVERGSEQPPHLAPRAVRCNHSGSPWAEDISETYLSMRGPPPISEASALTRRNLLRSESQHLFSGRNHRRRGILMTYFDPKRTVQIDGAEKILSPVQIKDRKAPISSISVEGETQNETHFRRSSITSQRALSSNYRWRDFDDVIREERLQAEGGEGDVEDEDFIPQATDVQPAGDEDDELSHAESEVEFSEESTSESERNFNHISPSLRRSARSQRVSRRNRERDRAEVDANRTNQITRTSLRPRPEREESNSDDSDDDNIIFEECLSTNNTPTGAYVTDYTESGHFFKMNLNCRIKRAWLCRTESTSSYRGRKSYAPQVGDSVVYIPKAHKETIRKFMTLKMPWQSWPSGARWPVVRCQILNVRYRFPYKEYFRRDIEARCVSVVSIITLEVTGIPELSTDREFPWPKPGFVARQSRSTSHKFEVSIFNHDCPEYVIPETVFLSRIQCLEDALRKRENNPEELNISACYFPTTDEEDPVIESSEAKIIRFCDDDIEFDSNLNKSGFESLSILWMMDGSSLRLSPWDVSAPEKLYSCSTPPSLTPEEKAVVAKSLSSIEKRLEFREFIKAVDTRRFSDYLSRIEVPMNISFVKQRLEHDYYRSLLSVLSEIRLIRENCQKYNGADSDIAIMAVHMYLIFKEELKTELEKAGMEAVKIMKLEDENETLCTTCNTKEEKPQLHIQSDTPSTSRSALELLPPPQQSETQTVISSSKTSRGGRSRSNPGQTHTPILERATSPPLRNTSPVELTHTTDDKFKLKNNRFSTSTVYQSSEFTTTRKSAEPEAISTKNNAGCDLLREPGRPRNVTRSGRIVSKPTRCFDYEENDSSHDDIKGKGMEEYQLKEDVHSAEEEEHFGEKEEHSEEEEEHSEEEEEHSEEEESAEESEFSEEEDDQDKSSGYEEVVWGNATKKTRNKTQKPNNNVTTALTARHSFRIQKKAKNLKYENNNTENEDEEESVDIPFDEAKDEHKYDKRNRGRKRSRSSLITDSMELKTEHSFRMQKGVDLVDTEESDVSNCKPPTVANWLNCHDDAKREMPIRKSTRIRKIIKYEDVDSDIDVKLESKEDKGRNLKRSKRVKTRLPQKTMDREKNGVSPCHLAQKSTNNKKMNNNPTHDGFLAKTTENISDIRRISTRKRKGINYQDEDSDIGMKQELVEGEVGKIGSQSKRADRAKRQKPQREAIELQSSASFRSFRKSTEDSFANARENSKDTNRQSARLLRSSKLRSSEKLSLALLSAGEIESDDVNGDDSEDIDRYTEDCGKESEDNDVDSENSAEDNSEDSDENSVPIVSKRRIQSSRRDTHSIEKRSRKAGMIRKKALPKLDKWPDIDVKDITTMSTFILEKLKTLDRRNAFLIPVVEAHPNLAEEYSNHVKTPMDFRTIEEERLLCYDNISQLQDDLIQVFKNCVDFNGPEHGLSLLAITLWLQINEIFYDVQGKMNA